MPADFDGWQMGTDPDGKGLRSATVGAEQTSPGRLAPRQGARVLLMDGTAVESAFALLLTKVTKPPFPAQISFCRIRHFYNRGENSGNEKDDQRYDWKRFYRPQ